MVCFVLAEAAHRRLHSAPNSRLNPDSQPNVYAPEKACGVMMRVTITVPTPAYVGGSAFSPSQPCPYVARKAVLVCWRLFRTRPLHSPKNIWFFWNVSQ